MKSRISSIALGFALCLCIAIPNQAFAWGNAGHEAVAYIAWQHMTPAARARAIVLLKQVPTLHDPADNTKIIAGYTEWMAAMPAGLSEDDQNLYLFMVAATWADSIKHEWLQDSDTPPTGVTTDVNIGYTDTASHGYWHFIDTGFASDDSTVPATPLPNAATQIAALRTAIASGEGDPLESYDLVWLEHLVGDIHQPLHATVRYFAGKGDLGGNDVDVRLPAAMKKTFEGTLSKSYPDELHAFWDDLPGEGQPSPALTEAAAFAKPLPKARGKTTDTDPNDWAAESLATAKADAYATPIGPGPKPTTGSSYLITTAYYNKGLSDAKKRIELAGVRLANLLNANLK
jgi:S1/P1 Nuclease